MKIIGIVGSEKAKFTSTGELRAKQLIRELLSQPNVGFTSGACHLGGIDIWAEEIADELKLFKRIFPPRVYNWSGGYKPRNIQIAQACTELHNITVDRLPVDFIGMRFSHCYHCNGSVNHIKSGGCWTKNYTESLGKPGVLHIIVND